MIIKMPHVQFDTLNIKFDLSNGKDGYKTILDNDTILYWTVEEYKEIHRQIKNRKPGDLV